MTTDVALPTRSAPPAAAPSRGWRQLLRFAGVGVASTAAYALLYLVLRPPTGPFTANALALLLTAVANTAANRRLTFGVKGSSGVLGDHVVGLLAFAAGLVLTSGALAALHAISDPARGTELVVLMVANALSTVLRFVVLKLAFSRRARGAHR
jgi:putative flippase GtrA